MKTYKHIITTIVAGIAVVGLTGCNDQLDINQNGVTPYDSYYKTDEDCEEATTAIYSELRTQYTSGDYSPWEIKTLLADEINTGGTSRDDNLDGRRINEYQFDYTNNKIKTVFQEEYRMIYLANLVIDHYAKPSTSLQKQRVAEAKVLRALSYFDLVTLWGPAPLVLEAEREDYKAPNSTTADLWAQIEKDLIEAINSGSLPQKSNIDDNVTGIRTTLQFAQALLGKAYVFQKKWAEAEQVLDQVVASGLYELIDDYGDFSKAECNNNREIMFSDNIVDDANNTSGIWPWGCIGWSTISLDTGTAPVYFLGFGQFSPSEAIVNDFLKYEPDSKRFHETMISIKEANDKWGVTLKPGNEYYANCGYLNWKWRDAQESTVAGAMMSFWTNDIIMKYSEVLLLDAEAKIMAHGNGAGDALINQIRTRAGVPNLSGATMDDVKREKRFELYMDGVRFQDLVRWGDAPTVLANQGHYIPSLLGLNADGTPNVNHERYSNPSYGFKTGKHELLPFPEEELTLNPNIVQNSGWETDK